MSEPEKIRILIADDFKILRDVIRLYLGRTKDMEVIGEAPELHQAVESAITLQPDVILMNDYLPPVDSSLAAKVFRDQGVSAAILSISMKLDASLIRRAFKNGVNGFIEKDEIDRYLPEAVRSVHRGEQYLSQRARKVYDEDAEE